MAVEASLSVQDEYSLKVESVAVDAVSFKCSGFSRVSRTQKRGSMALGLRSSGEVQG